MPNLFNFIDTVRRERPRDVLDIHHTVSPRYETAAILTKLEQSSRFPIVFFHHVDRSAFPVVSNVCGTQFRLALALGCSIRELRGRNQAFEITNSASFSAPRPRAVNRSPRVPCSRVVEEFHSQQGRQLLWKEFRMTLSLFVGPAQSLLDRIRSRQSKIGIIGLGYVGLPLALLFAEEGFSVLGFDIDAKKVQTLIEGESYIYRVPKTEIQLARRKGFDATSDYTLVSGTDAIVICVPTPLDEHRQPDLSYVRSTVESVAPHLRPGQLLILESTTYPGTTDELVVPIVERLNRAGCRVARNGEPPSNNIFVAFSPEREDPGNDSIARRDVPKVVGGVGALATELARELYTALFHRVVTVSSPAVAEMSKLLENIYRCVNIALVNELKLLCLRWESTSGRL
jgi:hypothetical protein